MFQCDKSDQRDQSAKSNKSNKSAKSDQCNKSVKSVLSSRAAHFGVMHKTTELCLCNVANVPNDVFF